ncbi:MAG: NrdH-redoxin [Anaerolineales bacterium]|uniref:NrdH-redoxin n=1 Tax=Candidatus Desulfolinea nitratireducens TaxID=2841698 RepID=A0A8J6NJ91_9CHLR|nr:NrdH-redoxin [Candidatus Desulfolinea nitratireducens]
MNDNLYSREPKQIILYGVTWCSDCVRAKSVLAEKKIEYLEINIDNDSKAADFVKEVNGGSRSVPTIIFPDGTVLVEPSNNELSAKLK